MQFQRCACPHCGTTLRVKDRGYLDRPVPCPNCRQTLLISLVDADRLEVRLDEPDTTLPAGSVAAASPGTTLHAWATNVTIVSWMATLVVAGMIGLALFGTRRPVPKPERDEQPAEVVDAVDSPAGIPVAEPVVAEQPQPAEPVKQPADLAREDPLLPLLMEEAEDQPEEPAVADAGLPKADVPEELGPVAAAIVPERPPIDFEAVFSQPLKSFRQDRAIPRRELLELLEEMLSAPIRFDAESLGPAAAGLDQAIRIDLEATTVGDVLARVLEQTNLAFDRERDGLRLRRKE